MQQNSPHKITDPPSYLTMLIPYKLNCTVCRHIIGLHYKKALFLFRLTTGYFSKSIMICPGTLWQRSVIHSYIFSSVMGYYLAFPASTFLGLVCTVLYIMKQLSQLVPDRLTGHRMFYMFAPTYKNFSR